MIADVCKHLDRLRLNCQSRYASCTTLQYTVVPSVRVACGFLALRLIEASLVLGISK